jgi:hypothetical protein
MEVAAGIDPAKGEREWEREALWWNRTGYLISRKRRRVWKVKVLAGPRRP